MFIDVRSLIDLIVYKYFFDWSLAPPSDWLFLWFHQCPDTNVWYFRQLWVLYKIFLFIYYLINEMIVY